MSVVYKLTYVMDSGIHGKGLFAKEDIESNAYLGEYEGPEAKRNGSHVLWVFDEDRVVGRSGRNKLRYLNHSKECCAEFDGFELYSARHIEAGEEITINYGEDWDDID
ncbi:MAG: hypothetical protein BMS9Abin25_0306 [Gammaproteobacteria bacterium]|nr:MAG: hypothetical protein BMS9Abin25_0306 [Gammaproteobacteria bacterium]